MGAAVALLCALTEACGETARQAGDGGEGTPAPLDASAPLPMDASKALTPLLDHESWRAYDAELDPLKSHQPAEVVCSPSGAYVEYQALEVDTGRCNYLLREHPALAAVPAGTRVNLTMLHYDLAAEEPAEAHVAVLFADAVQWETTIPVPSNGKGLDLTFTTNRALEAGEPIRLHLHNHGPNTWLFISLDAELP